MADILATWLNEEVGLSKVSFSVLDTLCRKLRTSSRTSQVATSWASSSTSSISKTISNCSLQSKFWNLKSVTLLGTSTPTWWRTSKSLSPRCATWTSSLIRPACRRSWRASAARHWDYCTRWRWSSRKFTRQRTSLCWPKQGPSVTTSPPRRLPAP